jgi:hypothetical protein
MYFAQIKNPNDEYPEPCGYGEKVTDTDCDDRERTPTAGTEKFVLTPNKYMYLNGYEILITSPNEGLLYLPLIKTRMAVYLMGKFVCRAV